MLSEGTIKYESFALIAMCVSMGIVAALAGKKQRAGLLVSLGLALFFLIEYLVSAAADQKKEFWFRAALGLLIVYPVGVAVHFRSHRDPGDKLKSDEH